MPLAVGTRLGPYEIIAALGAGGMGEVYRAKDPRLGRDVAIKVLREIVTGDRRMLARFEQEARSASALNHSNIVTIYDIGHVDSISFIVMEFINGQSLRKLVASGCMSVDTLLSVAVQVAGALAEAHAKGIVHRDLKPENIMVCGDGKVKLLDFGLAKLDTAQLDPEHSTISIAGSPETQAGTILGTLGYMSPQQAAGRPVDFRCDQFAFGAILYEMATGKRAFLKETGIETLASILRDEPESIGQLGPHVPLPLQWVVKRCLAKSPEDRYASTADLERELVTIREHLGEATRRPDAPPPGNVPSPRTALIGRHAEVAMARQLLLQEGVRLLTLTGAGGTGKTRLALAVAAELAPHFPGGVFFVPLASVSDPALVAAAIAQSVGVRQTGARLPGDELKEHLRNAAPTLILIDNFEQVLEAAPLVSELLAMAPSLQVFVTSRSVLRLYAEREFPVLPLELPDLESLTSLEALLQNPAVALFVERASAVMPGLTWNEENALAAANICARLDGLPLAIELAAARIKMLPPQAILARLHNRLQLLTAGPRDLPARQQTLRSTIDWSHGLLSTAEQRLFRRLSVFAGGCTLEAAEAVCDARADLGMDLFDGMASLVDKSLVHQIPQPDGEARFRMLETIREYGLERLESCGESQSIRRAQAAYCVVLAEEGGAALGLAEAQSWVERFTVEHDNFRLALEWLTETGNVEWSLRLANALFYYWHNYAHSLEGFRRFQAILALPAGPEHARLRAKAMFHAGNLPTKHRDLNPARKFLEQALDLYRELGDWTGILATLNSLAVAQRKSGNYAEARSLYVETVRIWEELGDRVSAARMMSNLADVALEQGDYAAARSLQEQCLETFRALGERGGAAWSLNHLGDVARVQGDAKAARMLYEQGLAIFRELNDWSGIARSLVDLGRLARARNEPVVAESLFAEALSMFQRLAEPHAAIQVLEEMAGSAADRGQWGRALRLAAAALSRRRTVDLGLSPSAKMKLEHSLEAARNALDIGQSTKEWMEGSKMSLEQAVRYALATEAS